ncbi:MAG: alkaline phosphatase family protein, partial [Nocardioidaceae bacterium]
MPSTPRTSAAAPAVRKVLVVVVENHSLSQMRQEMPYTFSLAKRFGYAEDYHAITHPSLPNYLAIAGGQTYGVSDDDSPSAHPLHGPSVFSQALAQGHTAGLFAEDMPTPCALQPSGDYAVKHNPWAYFV